MTLSLAERSVDLDHACDNDVPLRVFLFATRGWGVIYTIAKKWDLDFCLDKGNHYSMPVQIELVRVWDDVWRELDIIRNNPTLRCVAFPRHCRCRIWFCLNFRLFQSVCGKVETPWNNQRFILQKSKEAFGDIT